MGTESAPGSFVGETLAEKLGLKVSNPDLLTNALTHRSYAFEHGGLPHNERLEFLGDSVLGLVVTDVIYGLYPDLPEGEMAKLRASTVNMAVLADTARRIGIGAELLLGKGEDASGGRNKQSILADTLEAIVGAIYLDAGLDEARRLIESWMTPHIRDHVEQGVVRDFKTVLQEVAAKQGGIPHYRVTSTGPDHDKRFHAEVRVAGVSAGEGEGRSKKEAEQAAAQMALASLTDQKDGQGAGAS